MYRENKLNVFFSKRESDHPVCLLFAFSVKGYHIVPHSSFRGARRQTRVIIIINILSYHYIVDLVIFRSTSKISKHYYSLYIHHLRQNYPISNVKTESYRWCQYVNPLFLVRQNFQFVPHLFVIETFTMNRFDYSNRSQVTSKGEI